MAKKSFFTKQRDSMDCGIACISMIAKHYGKHNISQKLNGEAFLSKDGISLKGISKAAEQIGFRSLGSRVPFTVLQTKVLLPCIAHWNQNHFVVIHKIKKHKKHKYEIHIADPGKGLIKYPLKEFLENWASTQRHGEEHGIILILEPTPLLYADTDEHSQITQNRTKFLWKYVVKYKKFFTQLILGLLLGSLLQLILPFLTQAIVDTGIQDKDIHFIWLILIAQMMLLFSRTAIEFIRNKILLHISTRINISLISDFFIKLMKLPMKFFDTKLTGDLMQRIDDHKRVETFLTSSTLNLIFSFFTFIVFGIVLFIYNTNIFITFLTGSILYAVWILFFLKKRRELDYQYFEYSSKNQNTTYQLVTGMQEIKLQGCEQRKRWEWEDIQADLFDVNLKMLSLQQKQQAGSIFINEAKNVLITVLAATAVINGQITLGMMLAIQYIIGQLNSPIEQLVQFIYNWQDVSISLERMNEVHTEKNEENDNKTISTLTKNNLSITLENVSFKYDEARSDYILNNINLIIPNGKITAIVGASGSGKTTLIKLLLGYYPPQKGTIYIGDQNLNDFNLTFWRNNCSAVMQDGFLFSDTIGNNIAIHDDSPNLELIRHAANIANVAEYIENLPLGYNTIIGQDGQGISQGQRQRILIARVVYKNPQFVFLDEATNALDANNEKTIIENLETFYKHKTVIIIAHRLSTVRNADQIVVLDKGEIIETGNHNELTKKQGKYFELVKNQLELGN